MAVSIPAAGVARQAVVEAVRAIKLNRLTEPHMSARVGNPRVVYDRQEAPGRSVLKDDSAGRGRRPAELMPGQRQRRPRQCALPMFGGHRLIGVVSLADVPKEIGGEKVGDLIEVISDAP